MIAATAHQRITRLAERTDVHRAFGWLHLHEKRLRQWQHALIEIPAPPFREDARAAWVLERFTELGLVAPGIDREGNVIGWLREPQAGEPCVLLSAHIDTVFPAGTPIEVREVEDVFHAPGACDNAAGATALLGLIAALRYAEVDAGANILFAANVGEEAEGNLRGMRHLFAPSHGRRVDFAIVLEGSGTETTVTRALGSRRFRVSITGPGGHSWSDAGAPNPVAALARAITRLDAMPLPEHPRTTVNVGCIEGGRSVTSIPESAVALFDLRSVDATELLRCEVALYRAVEDVVLDTNASQLVERQLHFVIESIGDRPAAELLPESRLMQTIKAVDRHLRLRTSERTGSTDANLPLSLGVESVALGCGGSSGGIHTSHEWYDPKGRELALRRILLVLLDCCCRAAEARSA